MQHQVALLGVRLRLTHRQALSQEAMVLLVHHSVRNLQRRQMRHPLRRQPRLFLQLTARQRLRIDLRLLPPALRKLQIPPHHGVPELLDQVDEIALRSPIQRHNDAGRVLVDHSIDPALPVRPLDHIFADAGPGIAVHLT